MTPKEIERLKKDLADTRDYAEGDHAKRLFTRALRAIEERERLLVAGREVDDQSSRGAVLDSAIAFAETPLAQ